VHLLMLVLWKNKFCNLLNNTLPIGSFKYTGSILNECLTK